jgi:hypothetical protein
MSQHKKSNSSEDCGCNVGEVERVVSAVAGGYLIFRGLTSGSLMGVVSAAIGTAGIYRAATGRCALYTALKVNTNSETQKLSHVAQRVRELSETAAEGAKEYGSAGVERAKEFTSEARNRVADAIAVK